MTQFTPHEAPVQDVTHLPLMHPGRPVGRDELLKEIYTQLQERRAVLLYGQSGQGKTALAAALAAAFTQQPGGVLWINRGSHPLASLVVRVSRALGLSDVTNSEQPSARIGALAAALTQKKPFIVLDNVTDALAPTQLIEKAADNLPMLLLSDTELEGPWQKIEVSALADSDSVTLFKQKSGITTDEHDIDIYGLGKLLAYQPFALVMAARGMVAARQRPGEYFDALKHTISATGDPAVAAITLSYRALNNALQGLMLMLGATFNGEASAEYISAISGVPEEGIQPAMNILAQLYLVEKFDRYGKPYYRQHRLVYEFMQAALKGKNQLAGLQQKVHDATLAYLTKHATPGAVDEQQLAKDMDSMLAAAAWAASQGNRNTANQMVAALTQANGFVHDCGYVYELLTLRTTGSGSTSAFPAYGPDLIPEVTEEQDEFYSYDDEEDEELDDFEDELEDEEDEDENDFFRAHMASARDEDFEFEEDEDEEGFDEDDEEDEDDRLFRRPVPASVVEETDEQDAAEDDDDDDSLFRAPRIKPVPVAQEEPELHADALQTVDIDQLRQMLAQAKQQGNSTRILQILKAIGKVQIAQSKDTEAITTYNEILSQYEQLEDEEGTLDTLNMLASLLHRTGNTQASIMHATSALKLAESMGERQTQIDLYTTLGDARQELGETEAAVENFRRALEICRKTDDRQHEALSLFKLGYAYLDNGDTDDAIATLDEARNLFRVQGKRDYEGRVLGGLGSANSELERWSEAIGYYQSALHIAREVGDHTEERLQLSNLAQAQEQSGKLPDALLSYRQSLHLAYEHGAVDDVVSAVVDLVRLMSRSNRLLDICTLLLNDAMALEPEDRDVNDLQKQIMQKKLDAMQQGIPQNAINGTAREYAANAYSLLNG